MLKKHRVARLVCEAAGITRKYDADDLSKEELLKLHAWMMQMKKELKEAAVHGF